jgi:PAS domain S-box-containing protein
VTCSGARDGARAGDPEGSAARRKEGDGASRRPRNAARAGSRRSNLLLAAVVALPLALLALGAWIAWRDAWRTASAEVQQASGAVAEYGLRVLSAHASAAGRVDTVLRGLSDEGIRAREPELHLELKRLVAEVPQSESAFVIDREGAVLLSASVFPVPRGGPGAADRDFFLALRADAAPEVHVSGVHVGRFGGTPFFAVSRRRARTGNEDLPPGAFDGLVNVPVHPERLAESLRRIVPQPGDAASLIRTDGEILANTYGGGRPLRVLAPFFVATTGMPERVVYEARAVTDGMQRLFAARRIEGWPIYAVAGRARADIVAAWRREVAGQLAVGVPATLALLGLALVMRRGQRDLADANAGLEARVAERAVALAESERRLQQALEAGRVFAFDYDAAEGLVRRSANAAAILGLTELVATSDQRDRFRASVHPDDRGRRDAALAALSPDSAAYRIRYRILRPDGGIVWLEDHGVARFGPDGRLAGVTGLGRDVTAEVEAEEARRASEARLRLAIEGAGLGTWEADLRSGTLTRSSNILGVGPKLPVAGFTMEAFIADCVHPDDAAGLRAAFEGAAAGAPALRATYRARRSTEAPWRWLETYGGVVARDPETGAPLTIAGVARDVTDQREAEAALAESERRLQQALEAGRVYAFEVDLRTGLTRRSANAAAILGLPPEEAVGRDDAQFLDDVHPDDREHIVAAARSKATPADPRYLICFRYRRPDGRTVWLDTVGEVQFGPDGAPLRVSGLARDVTARAEAEEAVRASEARLRLAIEGADLGIWEIDLRAGTATRRGPRILAEAELPLTGFSVEAAIARLVHPEDAPRLRAELRSVAEGRAARVRSVYRARRPDRPGWVWIETYGAVVERDPATGEAVRLAGVSRDVTDQRAAGAALDESERRLQQALEAGRALAFDHDLRTNVILRSDNAAAILGLPPEVATRGASAQAASAVHPEDAPRRAQARAGVTQANPRYIVRFRFRRPDGGLVWLEEHGVARFAPDGTIVRITGLSRDVTAEAEAKVALRESVARLRLAFEGAGLGAWEVDLRTGRASLSGRRHLPDEPDLPQTEFLLEESIERVVHPEDAPRLREVVAAAAAGVAERIRVTYRSRRPHGEGWRWVEAYGAVVERDPASGAPVRLAGVSRDVTDQKEAGAALAESERRLRAALEAGRVFALEFDPAADLMLRSANAAAILGLPAGEAAHQRGTAFLERIAPEDRERLLGAIAAATPDRPDVSTCFRYPRADGRVVWLQDDGVVRFGEDGRVLGVTSLCRDVTAEVEAEVARREGELRLRAAAEGAGFGTYEIDFVRGLAWFDARAVAVVGPAIPAATWIRLDGREWAALAGSVHPDDRGAFAAAWENVASGDAEGWTVETRLRRPDGGSIWALCHGTVLERDPATGRRPWRLVGIVQDVSGRHRIEEELRQGQKLQALGALAGGIAHDFNNVLQAVSGAAALVEREPGHAEAALRGARRLAEAARRGAAITGRLLAFARRSELRTDAVDPAALLHEMREMLAPTLGPRIELRVDAPEGLPPLLADRGQLETALVNLATNARDAMPGGGVLIFSAAAEGVGHADAAREGGHLPPARLALGRYLRLSVRDTGTGMDAATLARVAEPFFTTKRSGEGTGLGLPMVKDLAEQSGGAFAIESAPGEGTTVTLWFPEAPAEAGTASPVVAPAPAAEGTRRGAQADPFGLLVVDDELIVRETIAEELEADGWRVHCAGDGEEALALLDSGAVRVDALVTDLTMPGLDGKALIREVRHRFPGLPALLLTGHAEDIEDERGGEGATACAAFALLRKPATGAAIAAQLRILLGAGAGAEAEP